MLLGPASVGAADQGQAPGEPIPPPSQEEPDNFFSAAQSTSLLHRPSTASAPALATSSGQGDGSLLHSNSSSGTLGEVLPGCPLVHLPFPPSNSPSMYQPYPPSGCAQQRSKSGSLHRVSSSRSAPQTDHYQKPQLQGLTKVPSIMRCPTHHYVTPAASSANLLDLSTTSLSTARYGTNGISEHSLRYFALHGGCQERPSLSTSWVVRKGEPASLAQPNSPPWLERVHGEDQSGDGASIHTHFAYY